MGAVALVTLVALVGVLGGCESTAGSTASTTPTTTAPTSTTPTAQPNGTATHTAQTGCAASQLTMTSAGSNVGAGNVGAMYRMESRAAQPCTVEGYPAVQLLNSQHAAMTTHTRDATSGYLYTGQAAKAIRLTHGGSAYFVMEWTQVPANGQTCPTASYVRVTPPKGSGTLVAAGNVDACGGSVTVSPVQAAAFAGFAPGPVAPTHVPTHVPTHTPTHMPTSTVVPPPLIPTSTTTSVPATAER